jgi:hypothetical protein
MDELPGRVGRLAEIHMAVDSKELHDGEMLILDKTGNTIGAYGTCFDWRCGMLQKNAFSN